MLSDFKKLILIASDNQYNPTLHYTTLKDRIINYNKKNSDGEVVDSVRTVGTVDSRKEEIKIIGNKKFITSYQKDIETGEIYKTTKEFQLKNVKQFISKNVLERREWSKFGVSKGLDPGPDSASTSYKCDEVFFEFIDKNRIYDDTVTDNLGGVNISSGSSNKKIKCKYCGGAHWSMKCTNKDSIGSENGIGGIGVIGGIGGDGSKFFSKSLIEKKNNYNKNDNTIRVSNISVNASEKDLRDLFSRFGYIKKMYFKPEKGFSFITFDNMDICQEAVNQVDKHPYDHLILSVEIAKSK